MNYLWGTLMLIIGLGMVVGSLTKSEFTLYRLLHARAKVLWKENTHTFLLISGLLITGVGSLFFFGIFG